MIYLDVDGVLLRRSQVSRSGFELLRYAEGCASCRLPSRILADNAVPGGYAERSGAGVPSRHAGHHFTFKLEELINPVEPAVWNGCKTEGIDLAANFYWIDDNPTLRALQVLAHMAVRTVGSRLGWTMIPRSAAGASRT